MCGVSQTRPQIHILGHDSFKGEKPFRLDMVHWGDVFQTLGTVPDRFVGQMDQHPTTKVKRWALLQRITQNWEFAEEALSNTFGVTHEEWIPSLGTAFGLQDPPTPFEVVGRLFDLPKEGRTGKEHLCGRSALLWYLIGMSPGVLENAMPGWEQKAAGYIRDLMTKSSFLLWALGVDLRPIIRSPRQAAAILNTDPTNALRKVRWEMAKHPYIRGLLISGQRKRPVPRKLAEHPPVWQNMEEKVQWEEKHEKDWQLRRRIRRRKIAWESPSCPYPGPFPSDWEPKQREIR